MRRLLTLKHHPESLHSTTVGFSHNLTPQSPTIIPDKVRDFDLPALIEALTQRLLKHYMRYPEHLFAQSRPGPAEILFWLTAWSDDDLSPNKRDVKKLAGYRPSMFEMASDKDIVKRYARLCNKINATMYYDPTTLELATLLLTCTMPIKQVAKLCADYLHKKPALEALLLLSRYDRDATLEPAQRAWQQHTKSVHYNGHADAFRYALITQDEAQAVKIMDNFKWPGFELRSLSMETCRLITRWEDFERIVYVQLQVYSPLALLAHIQNFGDERLELALEKIAQRWSSTWGCVFYIHHPTITKLALQLATSAPKSYDHNALRHEALRWLHREGANAIVGALSLWEDAALGQAAQDLLKAYIEQGHEALVLELAQTHAPQHLETLQTWAQASPAPDAPLPAGAQALEYWFKRGMRHPIPDGIMPNFPILTAEGHPLSPAQLEGLLRLLQDHKRARAQEDSKHLGQALALDSRLKLAQALLTRYDTVTTPSERWTTEALIALCPEGLEPLYPLHAAQHDQRFHQGDKTKWTANALSSRWMMLLKLMLKMPNPSHDALLARELIIRTPEHRESPLKPQIDARLNARALELKTTHLFTVIEASITQAKLPTAQLCALYHELIFGLNPQWTGKQWRAHADALVAPRAPIVWLIRSPTGADERTFRLDHDGSTLDALDRNIIIDDDMIITYASSDKLSPKDARAWERVFVEHELISPRTPAELGFTKQLI